MPIRFAREICIVALAVAAIAAGEEAAKPVEFNRDIRPILSDKCFTCHGPDKSNRLTPLRFDQEEGAFVELKGGKRAIVRGDTAASEMYRRIASDNEAQRMPPAYAGHKKLLEREIELIRRWIEQGAPWQRHWSLIAPKRPEVPRVGDAAWPRNPIDYFVLERLEREGLAPSPEAEAATLIRRASLDLTGLPPTPAEADAFVADRSPDAYEKLIDRLLASPRYGERMAFDWLNAARYADTNGYQTDAERYMWRWRDWVIDAFNRNMPFDRFTVEQIAGDMLPGARLDQVIASGFNRNHRGNGEGGIVPEEYAVEYVVDRVDTTSTVWLGLTMGCARCHDHKYDPITQKEYYKVFAYFNNVPERGRAFKYGNSPPVVKAPTEEQRKELARLDESIAGAKRAFSALREEAAVAQRGWEKSVRATPYDWTDDADLMLRLPLGNDHANPGVKPRDGVFRFVPGRLAEALAFDGAVTADAGNAGRLGFHDKFTLSAWIYPTAANGAILSRAQDSPEGMKGYAVVMKDGRIQVNLVQRWLDDALRAETKDPIALNQWHHVAVTYDASLLATGLKIYVDGVSRPLNVLLDELNQTFAVGAPLLLGALDGSPERFQGLMDEVRIYRGALSEDSVAVLAVRETIGEIAAIAPEGRSEAQRGKLSRCFLGQHAPTPIRDAWNRLAALRRERETLWERVSTVMVMAELETPRDTFVLARGEYDKPREKVNPGIPASLPPLNGDYPNNRLGFARWLVDPANPLTARVAVNRLWQMVFGVGIVKTAENFGSQGEWPSHPELLDWLATEFVQNGWDTKALLKLMVTSAAYRQSSKVAPALIENDPENRLLARGPRFRIPPEMVRDQALAAAGLLTEKIGGPSVKPYQPAGLWSELAGGEDYVQDDGPDLYRRSLYTLWKRTAPPPSMMIFDAPGREACAVLHTRTNTPLQALDLMNNVTYLEAARKMAERMMLEGGSRPEARIEYGFRLATGRRPAREEARLLADSLGRYRDDFATHPGEAAKLLRQGESPRNETLDVPELASYAMLASLILNLDETITKE
ncbi:MAG: DUF1553 domain-containing protein [Bryobacteraceae bacterium]|nr:DUF1553 domain-containing protein [Bryobacteraceae bacterium]